ncbi:MAG: hypothetical protein M1128_02485 [Candidatus Marsarchaeota archaeon]|nr:hypothetical protein [Candidatus Marsarchaeota archaeon]
MVKQRGFSLYDIEDYLKEAGAEKIKEGAILTFEQELEDTVKNLVSEAKLYADYAGRKSLITHSDINLISHRPINGLHGNAFYGSHRIKRVRRSAARLNAKRIRIRSRL